MRICELYNYKDAYKIYKILLHKNHANMILISACSLDSAHNITT